MSLGALLNQSQITYRFTSNPLQPAIFQSQAPWIEIPVTLQKATYFDAGTVLGQVTAANAADVQTISVSGGSGSMVFSLSTPFGILGPFAYNISTAALQAALQAVYGSGNVLVTGTAGTSYVITSAADLHYGPLPLLATINVTSGLTVTIAHTTTGVQNGVFAAYSGAVLAAPTAAPTMTDGATGTWPAGAYTGCYSYANANGETTPSPMTAYASAGTKKIHFAAVTSIPSAVTTVKFYVDGQFVVSKTPSSGTVAAFDIDLADIASGSPVHTLNANTAYTAVDGSYVPVGVLKVPAYVDVFGNIFYGSGVGVQVPVNGLNAPMVIKGYLRTEQLIGLDAHAVSVFGRLVFGTTSNGLLVIN